ncbi:MAG: DUF2344 domain-containing protein [Corynebacteriales bacterium]|nr:DUF2344 domain-containing protein [Mycobacteriales bacterium]
MARQSPNLETAPVVQRLRIRYAKRGRLCFTSHRDFARAFERALRRANVPMAFSAGFSQHPKISYVGAAPTGVASEAEYVEIGLTEPRDADEVRKGLDDALPPGLDILEVVPAPEGSFADLINTSAWRIELPDIAPSDAEEAMKVFLAAETVPVERLTKKGRRELDARAAVQYAAVTQGNAAGNVAGSASASPRLERYAIIEVVVQHTTPVVRPDDVLTGLRLVAQLTSKVPARAMRIAQGALQAPEAGAAATSPIESWIRDPLALTGRT